MLFEHEKHFFVYYKKTLTRRFESDARGDQTLLFFFGLIPLLVFYFRVEEKFAAGKFREIPCAVDNYFAGEKFRAKSKFENIAKISSTRKIRVIQ